jgi:hypothetical protein
MAGAVSASVLQGFYDRLAGYVGGAGRGRAGLGRGGLRQDPARRAGCGAAAARAAREGDEPAAGRARRKGVGRV